MYVKKLFAALLAMVLSVVLALPAQAATQPALSIVALGDSYASGVGAGSYIESTGSCWQSMNSTSQQVVRTLISQGREVELTNFTCSGDTIKDVRTHQLGALKKDTHAVIMSIGGNDVGFGPLVKLCLTSTCSGMPVQTAEASLPLMGVNLVRLLSDIHSRSPHAQIILVGYGQPMTASANGTGAVDPICGNQYFDQQERKEGAQFSAALDFTLRVSVEVARLQGGDVTFVSPYQSSIGRTGTLQSVFAGHSLCDAGGQYYRGFDALAPAPIGDPAGQTALLHMNAAGYSTLASLVTNVLKK
jgi:lysophospholipase L1-like esterase